MADNNKGSYEPILQMQFDKSSEKRKLEYGHRLSKSFWDKVNGGTNTFFKNRNSNWETARKYSSGKISHTEFISKLGIEGNSSYVNIDYDIAKILPKYQESLVGGWMDRDETPKVRATDILSSTFKEREKFFAKFRMKNKDKISKIEEAAGMKMEDGFTPQDETELDIYYKTKYRLPEEAFFQKTLKQIYQNNNYDNFKREVLIDGINNNTFVAKIEVVNSFSKTLSNRIKLRRCKPSRVFYNVFESPIGSDISTIGEVYPITIAEARRRYPKISEPTWYKIADKAQTGLKLTQPLSWNDTYQYSLTRPYDDYSFNILDYEVKTLDKEYHVKTQNQYGRTLVVAKKEQPNPRGDQKMKGETIENQRFNIYCGIYAVDADVMLDWDLQENMIRPYQNGVDVFFSYTIVMPNNDGSYQPSLIERGISNVKAMALIKLKIAQLVSLMKADGVSIDVGGLDKVNLSNNESYSRMEIKKIYNETGEVWWDSTDTTGTGLDGEKQPPIRPLPSQGNIGQIDLLIRLYNFELQNLNDEFGVNADFLGATVAAKRGAKVSDNQVAAANKATEYIYTHFLWFMSLISTKINYKLWDMVVVEASDYKQMQGMASDMIDTTFDVSVEMSSKSQDKADLMQMINISLEQKIISTSQAMQLKDMEDIKDAILYIEHAEEKAAKAAQESAAQNIKSNAEQQQGSLMAKAKADIAVIASEGEKEAKLLKAKGDSEAYVEIVKMVRDIQIESMKLNTPIPDSAKPLIDALIKNVVTQSIVKPAHEEELKQKQEQLQQQQEEMQQQQQAQ